MIKDTKTNLKEWKLGIKITLCYENVSIFAGGGDVA